MNHKYYFINRPPSIGTHPAGESEREVWQPVRKTPSGRWAHGWVEYPERLDFAEIWNYELWPADHHEFNEYRDWRDEVGK